MIIPTYHSQATLGATLASVVAQDHGALEAIVVNDGGPDPAVYLGEQGMEADPRVKFVTMARNGGVSAARNRGLAEAKGDLVQFLDADDLVAPDMLSFAVARFADPEVRILNLRHRTVESDRLDAEGPPAARPRDPALERLEAHAFFARYRASSGRFIFGNTVLRRGVLDGVATGSPWSETLRSNEDCLLFLTLALEHDIHLSEEVVLAYRRHSGSLSQDETTAWAGRITAMEALAEQPGVRSVPALARDVAGMRQNAARRLAALLRRDGGRGAARKVLFDDLRASPNWKSAVAVLRTFAP